MAQPHYTFTPTPQPVNTKAPATPFPTWTFTATLPDATPIPTGTPLPTPEFVLCSPVASLSLDRLWRFISVPYLPPPMGEDARHQGVDIAYYRLDGDATTIMGVGVQAVLSGRVAASIADSFPFGNLVILETPRAALTQDLIERLKIPADRSLYLLFAHLQAAPLVSLGQEVAACQIVGYVGASGNTSAPHLHLETRLGPPGISFEVFSAFTENVTPQEAANYRRWRVGGEFVHFDPMKLLDPQHPSPTVTPRPTHKAP